MGKSNASRSLAPLWSSRISCFSMSRWVRSTPICARAFRTSSNCLQRHLGITFVFVTHAQSEALALSDRIVVMNAGRIEQISAPYELYTRPRSQFVAKFIGRNALINGKVISADTNGCRLDTAFGELAGTSRVAMRAGSMASLAVPAEAIDILPASTLAELFPRVYGGNPIKGTVRVDSAGRTHRSTRHHRRRRPADRRRGSCRQIRGPVRVRRRCAASVASRCGDADLALAHGMLAPDQCLPRLSVRLGALRPKIRRFGRRLIAGWPAVA